MSSGTDDHGRKRGDGEQPQKDEHWDELDAVRRFPSEDEWLDLPMPSDADLRGDDDADRASGGSFADRVLRARNEEVEVDAKLAELDEALPNELLQQFAAPAPSAGFAEQTARRVHEDRRQRWAETLSRYVAPEPSPEFVDRTMDALREDRAQQTSAAASRSGLRVVSSTPVWGLLSAAAAALLYFTFADRAPAPHHLPDRVKPPRARRCQHRYFQFQSRADLSPIQI